jgi:DNA-binding NtrC family response regulator
MKKAGATLCWVGTPAPAALVATLAAQGIQVVRNRETGAGTQAERDGPAPLVVSTRQAGRVPARGGPAGTWLWVNTARVSEGLQLEAVARGAYDVISLTQPDAAAQIVVRVRELLTPPLAIPPADLVVTNSEAARRTIEKVARVAPTSMAVLLTGETGTGKEVTARLLHAWSPRRTAPFVPINCAAIPNELMEAELFGYARGAFSGAVQRYDGQLMAAAGGTVFLDEIDDTSAETQIKLLRVLEDRVVSRLGENAWHQVDFRIVAATNRDLRQLVDAGRFGMDLYERLAIVTVQLPPLRARVEDLPALVDHFLSKFAREQNQPRLDGVRGDALRALQAYPWPGNIRELRNVIFETLVYKRAGRELIPSDLPRRILRRGDDDRRGVAVDRAGLAQKIEAGTINLAREVAALERAAIEEALTRTGGNAAAAARLLAVGLGTAQDPGGTLRAMMRRLNVR